VTHLLPAFQELLVSPARLELCMRAGSMTHVFDLLRQWWGQRMTDRDLLAGLEACNRQVLELDAGSLAGCWVPYAYQSRTSAVSWCMPRGRATMPFFDQFIGQCRSLAVNQLLRPRTALARFPGARDAAGLKAPAGFIFHVSRCGSTLVSGCLSELEGAGVLSESPLLTEVLLDPGLNAERRRELLPSLLDMQRRGLSAASAIVKWNTWDLFQWPLIRALYPRVPVLLLFRDPVEVLASHRNQAGRHMSGDPSLTAVHSAFAGMSPGEDMLDFRIRVLHALYETAASICDDPGVMAVDYRQLDAATIRAISLHFGIVPRADECARMRQRMKFHSKEPRRDFRSDSAQKRSAFGAAERARIDRAMEPSYRRLLSVAGTPAAEAAC
jgi:hypothetical protein